MPDCSDSAASDASEFCVATQHSARSAEIFTVQFIGSIVACARNGVLYTASTFFAAAWIAPAPSSQTIGSASSADLARHHVSATTATVESFTLTTRRKPGRLETFDSSKLTSLPPNTGQ